MAYNDKVVDVTVNLGTKPIDTVSFNTPLFVAVHNVFPERARAYISLDAMVADGFAVGSPAHKYASKVFSGNFASNIIVVGRQSWESTEIIFRQGMKIDPENPVAFNVKSGSYTKSIALNATNTGTPVSLAEGLVDAINNDSVLNKIIEAVSTGTSDTTVTITATGTAAEGSFSIGVDFGDVILRNTSSETLSEVLPEVEAENSSWYFLSEELHNEASILAAAEYAETNFKLHVYSTADTESLVTNGDSIANQLKALQYDCSIGMYDPQADEEFPESGIVGAMASNDPSYGDSIHLKTMPGVIAPKLSTTQSMNIWDQNLNFYRMINGVGAFWEGKCASGQYVDVVRFGHWIKFRTEESLFGYMSRRSNMGLSVRMSDDDLPNLKAVIMNNPINPGIRNGAILTGYDDVNKTFYDPVVTIPKRSQIPTNDIASRTLDGVKVELVYNGALHFIKIRISVLLDNVGRTNINQQNLGV